MSPGSPYVGESILRDIKAVLRDFKPTKIFVSHPADAESNRRRRRVFYTPLTPPATGLRAWLCDSIE